MKNLIYITIKNIQNGDIKKLKFKHAEKLIADGNWQITQNQNFLEIKRQK